MNISQKDIQRFWSKVDIRGNNECWEWMGARKDNGYGNFYVENKTYIAHRIAWQIDSGREPREGYEIAHAPIICHNPSCCNPIHLSEKTSEENKADMKLDGTRRYGKIHSETMKRFSPKGDKHWSRLNPERVARGEKHGNSKLTQENINTIRELRGRGIVQRVVAKMFGISRTQVSHIENHKQWG